MAAWRVAGGWEDDGHASRGGRFDRPASRTGREELPDDREQRLLDVAGALGPRLLLAVVLRAERVDAAVVAQRERVRKQKRVRKKKL